MNSNDYFMQGLEYADNGEYQEAIRCFKKATELNPTDCDAWLDMGVIYFNLEQLEAAEQCYRRILNINPKDSAAYNNLGNIYFKRGQYGEAFSLFKKAIEYEPGNVDAFHGLGMLCATQDRFDLAKSCFEKILSIDNNHLTANIALGKIYVMKDNTEEANKYFIKAAQLGSKETQQLLDDNHVQWKSKNDINKSTNHVTPQICKDGSTVAYYHFWEIDENEAKRITELVSIEICSAELSNQSMFDISLIKIPASEFNISKENGKFKLDFLIHGYHVEDYDLELAKDIHKRLSKENLPSSVSYSNCKSHVQLFEYSKRNYWSSLLKNNLIVDLWVVIFLVPSIFLSNLILSFLENHISNFIYYEAIRDYVVTPVLGYPVSVVAFKLYHMTWKTKFMTMTVILLTVFLYYFIAGYGLNGSLILLGLFVISEIKSKFA